MTCRVNEQLHSFLLLQFVLSQKLVLKSIFGKWSLPSDLNQGQGRLNALKISRIDHISGEQVPDRQRQENHHVAAKVGRHNR
mmetsp:Transcript_7361/g.20446  ORF Transcript_7361/g.20446 Transcript_7361/m.20446 type:complete len:82 (-) Transcript_7361:1201-1446(-)